MVSASDVRRIVTDAARLVGHGEIIVFGSSALAFWLTEAPATRDVDLWCEPPDRGDLVVALMGELSWYHEKHAAYVEVWAPETFAAPGGWRARTRRLALEEVPGITIVVPHPHDVLLSKLERFESQDVDHARRILHDFPLDPARLDELVATSPYRTGAVVEPPRIARFERGLALLRRLLDPSSSAP